MRQFSCLCQQLLGSNTELFLESPYSYGASSVVVANSNNEYVSTFRAKTLAGEVDGEYGGVQVAIWESGKSWPLRKILSWCLQEGEKEIWGIWRQMLSARKPQKQSWEWWGQYECEWVEVALEGPLQRLWLWFWASWGVILLGKLYIGAPLTVVGN